MSSALFPSLCFLLPLALYFRRASLWHLHATLPPHNPPGPFIVTRNFVNTGLLTDSVSPAATLKRNHKELNGDQASLCLHRISP